MPLDTYLLQLVAPLLSKPDDAKVVTSHDDMGVLLTLTVAKEDMGIVIGKAGETAKHIRFLIRIVGLKEHIRASVKINEPDGTPYELNILRNDKELVA